MPDGAKRLGEIMVSLGFVSGRNMRLALRKQAKMKEAKGYALRIGHLLLEDGIVTEQQLAVALASQFRTGAIDLAGLELNVGLLKGIPEPVLEKYAFVPIRKDRDGVHIATDELLPRSVVDGLARAFGCPVHLMIAQTTQLQKARRWCRQHRRRLMSGQLEKVTLPAEYFLKEGAADPESTIKPGAFSVNSLKPMPSPIAAGPPPRADGKSEQSLRDARSARRKQQRNTGQTRALEGDAPSRPGMPAPGDNPEATAIIRPGAEQSPNYNVTQRINLPPGPPPEFSPEDDAAAAAGAEAASAALDDPELSRSRLDPATAEAMPGLDDEEPEEDDESVADAAAALALDPDLSQEELEQIRGSWDEGLPAGDDVGVPVEEVPVDHWSELPGPDEVEREFDVVEVESTRIDAIPPLSRLLVAKPVTLESLLRELKDAACETVTLVPRGSGADVVLTDEDGSRVSGSVGPAEHEEIQRQCLELLETTGEITVPIKQTKELEIDGAPMTFRLTALPSNPPTLAFSAADRDAWIARRQVQETPLVDALTRRARQRRGLIVVAGDAGAPVTGTVCGLLSALRRARLRMALYAGSAGARVREVTAIHAPPEKAAGLLAPEHLLSVTATGVDLLAFDLPLSPEQLKTAASLASSDAAVMVAVKQRNTIEGLSALVAAKLSPALIASVIEMVISVHRADRLCPACRKEVVLTEAQVPAALKASKLADTTVFEPVGCALCDKGVRGSVLLYETLTWDRAKAGADVLALEKKLLLKKLFELQLVVPVGVEARKALVAGSISFKSYLKLLGLAA